MDAFSSISFFISNGRSSEYDIAFTSICELKCSANSSLFPVKIFTTPPGTSEEFKTSAKVIEGNGYASEDNTTQVFPPAIEAAMDETSPSSGLFSEERIPTTPVGSKILKLKCELATGFIDPNTC